MAAGHIMKQTPKAFNFWGSSRCLTGVYIGIRCEAAPAADGGLFLLAPSVFKRRELPEHIAEYGIAVNEIGAFYKVPVPVRAEGV